MVRISLNAPGIATQALMQEVSFSSGMAVGTAAMVPQGSAILLGAMYGLLHAVGPDHLGTVMSLSLSAGTPRQAFSVGAIWSLAHSVGMITVATAVLLLQHVVKVNVEAWEHIGDYIIGASMMACGLYFYLREDQYIVERKGSVSMKDGCCHGQAHGQGAHEDEGHSHGHGTAKGEVVAEVCEDQEDQASWSMGSVLLGLVQGICCPLGFVGLAILSSLPAMNLVVFTLTFLLTSAVGVGSAAYGWASFAGSGGVLANRVSVRTMYRTSCGLTVVLGGAWVVANGLGVLDKLNYAEGSL